MADLSASIEIPKRALFKAAEVCDIVKVQSYVLRSWEAEFPALGITKTAGGPRVYRRADVEQVARIKHLLLVEGLTLAGARRRIEEEATQVATGTPLDDLIDQNARERLTAVRRGLRGILDLLAQGNGGEFRLSPPAPSPRVRAVTVGRVKPSRGKASAARRGAVRPASARRKRSA